MCNGTARRAAGGRPRRRAGARWPAACSPTSAPRSCSSSRPAATRCAASPTASTRGAPGKRSVVVDGPDDPRSTRCSPPPTSSSTHPASRARWTLDPGRAPDAVWVSVTPFGLTGPRSRLARVRPRRDGGERQHVLHRRPRPRAGAVHRAVGLRAHRRRGRVRRAHRAGRPVARSASTCRCRRSCSSPTWRRRPRFPQTGFRGPPPRRATSAGPARSGRRSDGFVSLRAARRQGTRAEPRDAHAGRRRRRHRRCRGAHRRDWTEYSPNTATDETLRAIEATIARVLRRATRCRSSTTSRARRTSCSHRRTRRARSSRARSSRRATSSGRSATYEQFPSSFVVDASRRRRGRHVAPVRAGAVRRRRPDVLVNEPAASHRAPACQGSPRGTGVNILEFGSGAAGPIATRYFVEHGATVLRVESKSRPDFLRVYALGPDNPHGLEGAPMYDGLNVGKRNVTFNLKHPEAVELVRRLVVEWADAVAENFAPRAMQRLRPRLRRARRGQARPRDGQRVPQRPDRPAQGLPGLRRPGLGARRATTSSPAGPTASRSARTGRSPTRSRRASSPPRSPPACYYRRRTGRGVYLDVSQVEAAIYTLSPWLLEYQRRRGQRRRAPATGRPRAVPHGAFPCAARGRRRRPLGRDRLLDRRRMGPARSPDRPRRSRARDARRAAGPDRRDRGCRCGVDPHARARRRRAAAGRGHRGRPGPGLRRRPRRPAGRGTASTSSR